MAEEARSFAVYVANLEEGDFNRHMSEQLHRMLKTLQGEVLDKNAPAEGTITLTLKFHLDTKGVLDTGYEAKLKMPGGVKGSGLAYVTSGGNVTFENPRQQKLPLREVGRIDAPAREV